jgi:hypothetical protein
MKIHRTGELGRQRIVQDDAFGITNGIEKALGILGLFSIRAVWAGRQAVTEKVLPVQALL